MYHLIGTQFQFLSYSLNRFLQYSLRNRFYNLHFTGHRQTSKYFLRFRQGAKTIYYKLTHDVH